MLRQDQMFIVLATTTTTRAAESEEVSRRAEDACRAYVILIKLVYRFAECWRASLDLDTHAGWKNARPGQKCALPIVI